MNGEATQRLTIEVVARNEAEKVLAQIRGSLSQLGMGNVAADAGLMEQALNRAFAMFGRFGEGARTVLGKLMAMATGVQTTEEGITKLSEALVSSENQLQAFGLVVGFVAIGIGKLAAVIGDELVGAAKEWFNEAIEAERVTLSVGAALDDFVNSTGDASLSIEELIKLTEDLSAALGISQTRLLASTQFLINWAKELQLTGDQIEQLFSRAAEVATAKSKSIEETVRAMVLGIAGRARQLGQSFAIKIDDAAMARWMKTTETAFRNLDEGSKSLQRFNKLMADTAGSADAAAKVVGGSLSKQLEVAHAAIEQFHEALGRGAQKVFGPLLILYAAFAKALLQIPPALTDAAGATVAFSGVVLKGGGSLLMYSAALANVVQGLIIVKQVAGTAGIGAVLGRLGGAIANVNSLGTAFLLLGASIKVATLASIDFAIANAWWVAWIVVIVAFGAAIKRAYDQMEHTEGIELKWLNMQNALNLVKIAAEGVDKTIDILAESFNLLAQVVSLSEVGVLRYAKTFTEARAAFLPLGVYKDEAKIWADKLGAAEEYQHRLEDARMRIEGTLPPLKAATEEAKKTDLELAKENADLERAAAAAALLAQQMRAVQISTAQSSAAIALAAGEFERFMRLRAEVSRLQTADLPTAVAAQQKALDSAQSWLEVVKQRVTLHKDESKLIEDRATAEHEAAQAELARVQTLRGVHKVSAAEVMAAMRVEGAARQHLADVQAKNAEDNARRMRQANEQAAARNVGPVRAETALPFTKAQVDEAELNAKALRQKVGDQAKGLAADLTATAIQAGEEAKKLSLFDLEKMQAGAQLRTELAQEFMNRMIEAAKLGKVSDEEALKAAQMYEDQLRKNILLARDLAKERLAKGDTDPLRLAQLKQDLDEAEARVQSIGLLVPEVVRKTREELQRGVLDLGQFVRSSVGQVGDALVDAVTSKQGGGIKEAFKGIATAFTKNVVNTIIDDKTKGLDAKLKVNFLRDIPSWVEDGSEKSVEVWRGAWEDGSKAIDKMGKQTTDSLEVVNKTVTDTTRDATTESRSLWGSFFDWIGNAAKTAFGGIASAILGILDLVSGGQGQGVGTWLGSALGLVGAVSGAGGGGGGGGGTPVAAAVQTYARAGVTGGQPGPWASGYGQPSALALRARERTQGSSVLDQGLSVVGAGQQLGIFSGLFGEAGVFPAVGKLYSAITTPIYNYADKLLGGTGLGLGALGAIAGAGIGVIGLAGQGGGLQKTLSGLAVARSIGSLAAMTGPGQQLASQIALNYPGLVAPTQLLTGANLSYGVPGGLIGPAQAGGGPGWGTTLSSLWEWVSGGGAAAAQSAEAVPVVIQGVQGVQAIQGAYGVTGGLIGPAEGAGAQTVGQLAPAIGQLASGLAYAVPVVSALASAYGIYSGIQQARKADTNVGKAAGAAGAAAGVAGGVAAGATIAGMVGGLTLAAASSATVPVIGWIVAIILIIVAVVLSAIDKVDIKKILREKFEVRMKGLMKDFDVGLRHSLGEGVPGGAKRVKETLGPMLEGFKLLAQAATAQFGVAGLNRLKLSGDFARAIANNTVKFGFNPDTVARWMIKSLFGDFSSFIGLLNKYATEQKKQTGGKELSAKTLAEREIGMVALGNIHQVLGVGLGEAFKGTQDVFGRFDRGAAYQKFAAEVLKVWKTALSDSDVGELKRIRDPFLLSVHALTQKYDMLIPEIVSLAAAVNSLDKSVSRRQATKDLGTAVELRTTLAAQGFYPTDKSIAEGSTAVRERVAELKIELRKRRRRRRRRGLPAKRGRGGGKRGKKRRKTRAQRIQERAVAEVANVLGIRERMKQMAIGLAGQALGRPEAAAIATAGTQLQAAKFSLGVAGAGLRKPGLKQEEYTQLLQQQADAADKAMAAIDQMGQSILQLAERARNVRTQMRDFFLQLGEEIDSLRRTSGTGDRYTAAIANEQALFASATNASDQMLHLTGVMDLLRKQTAAYVQDLQDELQAKRDIAEEALHGIELEQRALDEQQRAIDDKQRALDEQQRAIDTKQRALDDQQRVIEDKQRVISERLEEISPLAQLSPQLTEQIKRLDLTVKPINALGELTLLRRQLATQKETLGGAVGAQEQAAAVGQLSQTYDQFVQLSEKAFGTGSIDARRARMEALQFLKPYQEKAEAYAKEERDLVREQRSLALESRDIAEKSRALQEESRDIAEKSRLLQDESRGIQDKTRDLQDKARIINEQLRDEEREVNKKIKIANEALADQLEFWGGLAGPIWEQMQADLRAQLKEALPGATDAEIDDIINNPQSAAMRVALYQAELLANIDETLVTIAQGGAGAGGGAGGGAGATNPQIKQRGGALTQAARNQGGQVILGAVKAGGTFADLKFSGALTDAWQEVVKNLWAKLDEENQQILTWIGKNPPGPAGGPLKHGHQGLPVPYLAAGGLVTRATQAVIGEAGAELVIPLDDPRSQDAMARAFRDLMGRVVQRSGATATFTPSVEPTNAADIGATGTGPVEIHLHTHVHLTVGPGTRREDVEAFAQTATNAAEARMVQSLETGALGGALRRRGLMGRR